MPKCAVQSCKNSSNNLRIRDGISFFHFPRDPELAERWWVVLSPVVSRSFKQKTAAVCSDHFQLKDKYLCKKRHRLTKNAIPDSNLLGPPLRPHSMPPPLQHPAYSDSSDEENAMVVRGSFLKGGNAHVSLLDSQATVTAYHQDVPDVLRPPSECTVCRLCLLSEGKMERVSEQLAEAYRQVTGIKWDQHDTLPQHSCWECSARVRSAAAVRARALAAHSLLRDVRAARGTLTLNDILLIDRSYHYLTSKLSQKNFPPNEYLSKTINNNQIFTKEFESNIDLTLNTDKNTKDENNTLTETRHFADIGNNDINAKYADISKIEDSTNGRYSFKLDDNQENEAKTAKHDDYKSVNNYINNNIDPSLHFEKEVSKKEAVERDDTSLSDCLVIDAEPLETLIQSEHVSGSDGGMPIDELIDIYNNDGDGDGRLQELNQQFLGGTMQIDEGWGGYRTAGGEAGPPPPDPARPHSLKRSRQKSRGRPRGQKTKNGVRQEHRKLKTYEGMNHQLFTITPVTDEEQIAELLKRQETNRYKLAPFKCNLCYRSYPSQRQHATHMRRHDAINGDYECHICKSRQKSPRAIRTHIYGQHSVRISCNQCSFVTMNRTVARSHERWHAGTVFQCPYCSGRFDLESSYKGHLRTEHVHAHVCAACGLTFESAKGLAVHRVKRHRSADKIPPDGPYCETCAVRFASGEAHARHLTMSSRHNKGNERTRAAPLRN